ncbi:MAG TPA: hypothetical protein VFZ53_23775, partial [Polyangiaceae bacterium]
MLVTVAKNEHWGGSAERFAESVASACQQRGLTGLLGQVLTYVASFGEVCFKTYKSIALEITRSNGKHPHVESIGRIVRKLADMGHLSHTRIGPGKKPHGARWPSRWGTTENRLLPTTLGVKRLARSERSSLRARAVQVLAPPAVAAVIGMGPPPEDRAKYSAPTPAAVALASRARARNEPPRRSWTALELDAQLEELERFE